MNRLHRCVIICATTLLFNSANAEDPISDSEQRLASINPLEQHIAQREKRLGDWGRDIVELDRRIEAQVDELVKLIAGFRDSEDSRTKVNMLKKDAIDGLQRGIEAYSTKRRQIAEKIRTGDGTALGDLDRFDEHILKRVDHIATLTKSIPTHQDIDKYETYGQSYWSGYDGEQTRISDEWKQMRRDSMTSDIQRKEAADVIDKGLKRIDNRRRELNGLLKNRELTDTAKELYTRELGAADAFEDHLNKQLREIQTSTNTGGTAVSMNQAQDIIDMVEDARGDLREDVASLFRKYDQFIKGRAYLESLKANLIERKKRMAR
jgi:hypothetical protein